MEIKKILFLFLIFNSCSSFENQKYIETKQNKINASSLKEILILQSVFSNTIFPEPKNDEEKYFIERIKEKLIPLKNLKEEKLISYHYTTRIQLENKFNIKVSKFQNLEDNLKQTEFRLFPHLEDSVSLFYPDLIFNYESFKVENADEKFVFQISDFVKKLNMEGILFELHFFEINNLNISDNSFDIRFKSYRSIITEKEVHTSIGLITPYKTINKIDEEIFDLFEASAYLSIDQLIQNFGTNSTEISPEPQK